MRNLLLSIMFLCTAIISAQKSDLYYVFIDLTDPELVEDFKSKIKEAVPVMLRKANVNSGKGIEIKFFSISNLKQGVRGSLVIRPRDIGYFENKFVRSDEVAAELAKLPSILGKFKEGDYPHTRIVDAMMSQMPKFKAAKARNKRIIVFSDLFENYTDDDTETLDWEDIYFVRGISEPTDQEYVKRGDSFEAYWRNRLPNVNIDTEVELY